VSPDKTKSIHSDAGFDCRGQHVCMYNGTRRIKPSGNRVKSLVRKVRAVIKVNKPPLAGQVIGELNPL
jgi:RNA-directed DNA polymerase